LASYVHQQFLELTRVSVCRGRRNEVQRVGLTGLAAVVDVVVELVVGVVAVIWTSVRLPPPPGFVVSARELFGLTMITLPTELVAEAAAASAAAVERSPATAAKEA
jgi:hypothetical protein